MASSAILLVGGGEFQKGLENTDREIIRIAQVSIQSSNPGKAIVLAVASSTRKAEEMAVEGSVWLSNQGAIFSEGISLVDRNDCENPATATKVENAKLIYIVGGDPAYIVNALRQTAVFAAIQKARKNWAIVAASGNGAMALAEFLYKEDGNEIVPGLNLIPGTCVIPYHGSKGRKWSKKLTELLPETNLLGIDEKAGMLGADGNWHVSGRGWVTVYKGGKPRKFGNGQPFVLKQKS
jgi:cyanophycinase-like exopeptidase